MTDQQGEGVKEVVQAVYKLGKLGKQFLDRLSVRTKASPSIRKFLQANGGAKITKITVSRKPIISAIDKIANFVSLGKWNENKKKLNYDNVFHLFMTITLDNGKTFKLEKNHVPAISAPSAKDPKQEDIDVPAPNISLADFFAGGEKKAGSPEKFWVYDAISANCQYFLKWLLQGAGKWTEPLNKFISQNTAKLIEGLPWFETIAKKFTDIANKIDVAIEGEGKKIRAPKIYKTNNGKYYFRYNNKKYFVPKNINKKALIKYYNELVRKKKKPVIVKKINNNSKAVIKQVISTGRTYIPPHDSDTGILLQAILNKLPIHQPVPQLPAPVNAAPVVNNPIQPLLNPPPPIVYYQPQPHPVIYHPQPHHQQPQQYQPYQQLYQHYTQEPYVPSAPSPGVDFENNQSSINTDEILDHELRADDDDDVEDTSPEKIKERDNKGKEDTEKHRQLLQQQEIDMLGLVNSKVNIEKDRRKYQRAELLKFTISKLKNIIKKHNTTYENSPGFTKVTLTGSNETLVGKILDGFSTVEVDSVINDAQKSKSGSGMHGRGGLYNTQIEKMMSKYPNFIGVIARDEIGKLVKHIKHFAKEKKPFGWIMNTDPAGKPGTHWVAIIVKPNDSVNYYDSFGMPAPPDIAKNLKKVVDITKPTTLMKFKENKIKSQSVTSDNCGWFCMKFISDMLSGKPFIECTGFSNVIKGEKEIEQFKKKFRPFGFI